MNLFIFLAKRIDTRYLCMQLLLHFYADFFFETSQVFKSCSEDMHIVWI